MADRIAWKRFGAAPIFAAALIAAGFPPVAAWAAATALECTNPASGATWQIQLDEEKRTVDSFPAEIDGSRVKWRDSRDGWIYKLDRASGKLTVYVASSTGGWLVFDRCKPSN